MGIVQTGKNINPLEYVVGGVGKYYDPETFKEIPRPTSGYITSVPTGAVSLEGLGLSADYLASFYTAIGQPVPKPITPVADINPYQGTPFRARTEGESMTSYLQAKQSFELSQTGKTGITLPEPTVQAAITGQQKYGDILTLAGGQKISPQDPNYAAYAKQMGITPTEIPPVTPTKEYIPNEAALQAKREELGKMGIPKSEWSKYISSPDEQGKIYYTPPTTEIPKLTQKQELQAAQDRITAGTASDEDKKNVAYAKSKGIIPSDITPIEDITDIADIEDKIPDITVTDQVPAWEANVASITGQLATLKADMKAIYEKQVTDKQTEIDKLTTEIEGYRTKQLETIKEADPEKSQFYTQQTTILQNQLNAAEIESSKLQKDLQDRRNLVAELAVLNETAFADIQAMKGVTGLAAIRTPRINAKIDEWEGRSSILTAAISGVEGNITMAYNVIDKAQADITDRRNEEITYYNALIAHYSGIETATEARLTTAQADKKEAAQNIVDMKQTEIDNLEAISTLVKTEMINDPARVAGAGINLATDDLTTISNKLANYDYGQEVKEIKNEQAKEGNSYLSSMTGITSEDQIVRQVDSRGKEWVFKKTDVDELLSVSEAKALGVPYGTTKKEAAAKGIIPKYVGEGVSVGLTGDPIVDAYVKQVQNGDITLNGVPSKYRNAVAVALGEGIEGTQYYQILKDSARALAELRDTGQLNDAIYNQEINTIMSALELPEEQRGSVESQVNNFMAGGAPSIEAETPESVAPEDVAEDWVSEIFEVTSLETSIIQAANEQGITLTQGQFLGDVVTNKATQDAIVKRAMEINRGTGLTWDKIKKYFIESELKAEEAKGKLYGGAFKDL